METREVLNYSAFPTSWSSNSCIYIPISPPSKHNPNNLISKKSLKKTPKISLFYVMLVSLEALAMAGMDSDLWAMDAEEWERNEMDNVVPLHLLADEDDDEDEDERYMTSTTGNCEFPTVGFFDNDSREDDGGGGGGVYCFPAVMWQYFRKVVGKRGWNFMSSMGTMVRAIVGFLMVMTVKIITSQGSKS